MSNSFEAVKARHKLAWGMGVEGYAKHSVPELAPVADRLIEIADPAWGASVIDIGCGPGTATLRVARRVGPGGRVVGVDLAPPMLAHAERRAQAEGLTNVSFVEGDAEQLEGIEDSSFDVAISNFGVIFAPEGERMLEAVARVLRPRGVFAFSTWVEQGIAVELTRFLSKILPPTPAAATARDSWGEAGVAAERMAPWFDEITWTDVEVPCEFANVDEAWTRMREGRPPFALAYGRMPVDQKQAVEEEARELFRGHVGPAGGVRYVRYAGVVRGVRRA
jgi:SAM-dependent methyltransferase